MFKKSNNKVRNKVFSILVIALVFSFAFGGLVQAAGGVEAFFPTYDTFFNGEKLAKEDVLTYNGETYVKVPALQEFGITRFWNEDDREAHFSIPNPVATKTGLTLTEIQKLTENSVRFYQGYTKGKKFVGNGVWVSKDTILTSNTIFSQYKVGLVAYDFNNSKIPLKMVPIKTNKELGLVLLQTTGAVSNSFAKLSNTDPVADDDVVICGSIAQVPNYVNVDKVHSYEDYDLFNTNNPREFMRMLNDMHITSIGNPVYDDDGYLVSMINGYDPLRKYALGVKRTNIGTFAPIISAEN